MLRRTPLLAGVLLALPLALAAVDASRPGAVPPVGSYAKEATWQATVLASRAKALDAKAGKDEVGALWACIDRDFPIPSDWMLQDLGPRRDALFGAEAGPDLGQELLAKVCDELGDQASSYRTQGASLLSAKVPCADRRWLDLYVAACEQRRARRLATLLKQAPHIAFAKHWNMGASHYAYTEAQSDGLAERQWHPGTQLCRLDMDGLYGQVTVAIDDRHGVIRDPNPSWDGKRLLFSWKKDDRQDDYHLYEMELASGTVRQLTSGLGSADYEGAYLPSGDIIFSSTRCVQTVDCWFTEVSNLYACDPDGQRIHRLGFDQVHTNFPQVLDDGRVTYTRWEYNDRGQLFPQPLFQMNPDGTGQTEFYGNNSWFPTSILHARGIPGTQKVVAICSGHHSSQAGKLIIVDPSKGRQEAEGVQLIAPLRETRAERIDSYGQDGDQFMYPYALNEREFILSFWADDHHRKGRDRFDGWFNIVYMDIDGRREILASDPALACQQPVPLAPRPAPRLRPSAVDYAKTTGSYYMQDVYVGPGLANVPRGTARKLRVVTLGYRAAPVRSNGNGGPAGGACVSTPIGANNASWDPKTILGDATIYPDGSAYFEVPARTPVYFQVLDDRNRVINSMRSWSTLMPGERFACTGCHENKNAAPPNYRSSQALSAGMETLKPFYGAARGFSFRREIQPILDRSGISCHCDREALAPKLADGGQHRQLQDLAKAVALSPIESEWAYATDKPASGWEKPGFEAPQWKKGLAGFGTGGCRCQTRWTSDDIWLRREFTAPDGVAGPYLLHFFHDEDMEVYLNGVLVASEAGYLTEWRQQTLSAATAAAVKGGRNLLAVHCHQTVGGQCIDVGLYVLPPATPAPTAPARKGKVFSLLGEAVVDNPSGRRWSDAYLALTNARMRTNGKGEQEPPVCACNALVSWVHPQSIPSLLAPYSFGSGRSELLALLDAGHGGTRLQAEELDKLAAWIDLGVPYSGDYVEANNWNDEEVERYLRCQSKRLRQEAIDRSSIQALARSSGKAAAPAAAVRVAFIGAEDAGLVQLTDPARPGDLAIARTYRHGDRITAAGGRYLMVRLDESLPEALIYAPDGYLDFALPTAKGFDRGAYPETAFAGALHHATARAATADEIAAVRNLALNPYDQRRYLPMAFPHASASSECRHDGVFAARNAIDGVAQNRGHGGWPHQSWGPEQTRDPWWQVDFGREVLIDKVVITLRADFPHDKAWKSARLVWSDGGQQAIVLAATAEPQAFQLAKPVRTISLRLADLVQDEPLGWCALSEVEAWGRDAGRDSGMMASRDGAVGAIPR